jgi:endonuclease YncB( thermonuclease family)
MATSAQLERKAERARERLSNRIADLRSQVSPMTVVSDLLQDRGRGDDFLPMLIKKASDNPIASVLIAAGMAWLIFSESKSSGLTKPRRTIRRGRKKGHTARNSKAAAAVRSN